jgi:hypothetical protein
LRVSDHSLLAHFKSKWVFTRDFSFLFFFSPHQQLPFKLHLHTLRKPVLFRQVPVCTSGRKRLSSLGSDQKEGDHQFGLKATFFGGSCSSHQIENWINGSGTLPSKEREINFFGFAFCISFQCFLRNTRIEFLNHPSVAASRNFFSIS